MHDCARIAQRHLGELGYLKTDSSLHSGFEIVTHPMSFSWAMSNFPWDMLTQLHEQGAVTSERTGLHVHVSRAGFASPGHLYRWMKFIYRNQDQVSIVARRTSQQWAAFTVEDRLAVKHYAKGTRGLERHRAINTTNTDTLELRIFASSLRPADVQAALAFTVASIDYAQSLTAHQVIRAQGWQWPAFATWVAASPTYSLLASQLEDLGCAC